MKIVLLSGGAGKRLWPLSTKILPKQFLKVLRDADGLPVSMVQKTWKMLVSEFGEANLFVAAGKSSHELIKDQLGDNVKLIPEPSQRDTFPAIAMASSYLYSIGVPESETVVVIPVDAYVERDFYGKLEELDGIVQIGDASLALVGIKPGYPSEKFGYILADRFSDEKPLKVRGFYEKPAEDVAAELIDKGALWNGGIFAFRLKYMKDFLQSRNYPWNYDALSDDFESLPRISFDYMVVEAEKRIACAVYEGSWNDLGSWKEMVRLLSPNDSANVIMDGHCEGTHVINHLSVPIVVAGIPNAVIAAGPEGILISDKSVSHLIKPLIEQIEISK